jgi:hypothetical protein
MRRNSGVLAWAALVVGAATCAGQERPTPEKLPAPVPAAGRPGAGETPYVAPLPSRPPYPPPLPAVVDPRTGAWRQVYVSPGECVPDIEMQVGGPCPRCGDKLRHPFHGRLSGALLRRHAQASDGAPCSTGEPVGDWAPADPTVVEPLPPRAPAGVTRPVKLGSSRAP